MFGGLEIKGASEKKDERQEPQGSAFSFMAGVSAVATPAETPATAAPSSFGFMTNNSAPLSSEPPSPAGASGFSFLSTAQHTHVQPTVPTSTTTSGFSFLSASTTTASATADRPPSFMSNISSSYADDTSGGGTVAGAGVTFGGSAGAAQQRKNIKRRSRAPKVGAYTAESTPISTTTIPQTSLQTSSSYGSANGGSGADGANEHSSGIGYGVDDAVRRAEEFLQKNLQEQSRLGTVTLEDAASKAGLKAPASIYSPDVDDELIEAQRAAEEAQARLAREAIKDTPPAGQHKSAFSWFGGLRAKSNGGSGDAPERNGAMSSPGGRSNDSSLMIPTPDQSLHAVPETQAERIFREQEAIKKSMAERHLMKMSKQEVFDNTAASKTVWDRPPVTDAAPSWTKPASELAASSAPAIPSWGIKVPTPPAPSPRQLVDIILQQFASDVRRAMSKVAELRQQRNMLLEERFVALAKERLAAQQIMQTETQQMDAAEQEDFELADRLQVILEGHNREKAECTAILDNIGKALAQLDDQTPYIVAGVTKCFENVAKDLEEFKGKQKQVDDPADVSGRFAATARQLAGEAERLKGEAKHLERDEELVKMERKELDDAIAEQTAEIEKVREDSREQLSVVEREMDELREKLRLKEVEAGQLKMKILGHESDISKILVKFNRQITRVQKKEMSVRENRREWTNESKNFERLSEAHEAEVKAHTDALLQRNSIMDDLKANISMADTFQNIIAEEMTFDHIREENEEVDGHLAQIQADVVKCEAAVSEAAQIAKVAEANLVSLDGESRRLQEKLPKLEEEKSKAAAKRDFKTAGRASKEIKEYSARLQELEESLISEAKMKHKEAKLVLARVQEELAREQATANKKEKESGIVSMKKIATRIKALLSTKKRVCGKASPDSVKGVGALVLMGQIDALKAEGQSLGHKFGGWDEIIGEIDETEEGDGDAAEEPPADAKVAQEEAEVPEKEESSRPSDEIIPEIVEKAKELQKKLAEAEEKLNAAAEQEDFEKAAELDEIFQNIKDELEKLDITDAEADLVMAGESLVAAEFAEKVDAPDVDNKCETIEMEETAQNGTSTEGDDTENGDEQAKEKKDEQNEENTDDPIEEQTEQEAEEQTEESS